MRKWIKIEDRLPDKRGPYLIWLVEDLDEIEEGEPYVTFFDGVFLDWHDGMEITHWQVIEPPEDTDHE